MKITGKQEQKVLRVCITNRSDELVWIKIKRIKNTNTIQAPNRIETGIQEVL